MALSSECRREKFRIVSTTPSGWCRETESPPGCQIRMGGATRFLRNASRSIGRNDNTASWAGAFKPKRYKWGRPVTLPTCLCPSQLINSSEAAESVITKLGLQRVSGPHVAGFRSSTKHRHCPHLDVPPLHLTLAAVRNFTRQNKLRSAMNSPFFPELLKDIMRMIIDVQAI